MYVLKMLKRKLNNLPKAFREKGFRAGLAEFVNLVAKFFYGSGKFKVYVYTLSDKLPALVSKPTLEIHRITSTQELAGIQSKVDPFEIARFYNMFKQGSICFFAIQNEEIAGYAWISRKNKMIASRVQPPLGPGEALMHDMYIFPDQRRCGIAEAFVIYFLNFLLELGYIRAVAGVDQQNKRIMNLGDKLGFRQIRDMRYKRFLLWYWTYPIYDP